MKPKIRCVGRSNGKSQLGGNKEMMKKVAIFNLGCAAGKNRGLSDAGETFKAEIMINAA